MTTMNAPKISSDKFPMVHEMKSIMNRRFQYFSSIFERQWEEFGDSWLEFFEEDMRCFFGDDRQKLEKAVDGYGRFALDGMKLQVEFNKTRQYRNKTYAEAADEVYQNRDYMFGLYLPGIFISHFLWRHHFLQHVFFEEKFVPLVKKHGGSEFYDIGVGTGFYSKEMLRTFPNLSGVGFDLSPFSLEHARLMVGSRGHQARYRTEIRDIIKNPPEKPAPFLVNIEVLEHLEDPQSFLNALNGMLEPGGFGLISAAITAPNADHIYLYNSAQDVIDQLKKAEFKVVDYIEDQAYPPRNPGDAVPVNGAFIVTK